jgi:hypothetical protein
MPWACTFCLRRRTECQSKRWLSCRSTSHCGRPDLRPAVTPRARVTGNERPDPGLQRRVVAGQRPSIATHTPTVASRPQSGGDERQLSGGETACRFPLTNCGNSIVPNLSAVPQYRRIATASSQRRCRICRADSARARPADCPAHACIRLTSPAFVAATLIAEVRPR